MTRSPILLNPGPVTLTARVRSALGGPDMCHREPDFAALTLDVRARLGRVYRTGDRFDALLLAGSGTLAVEAMLASLVPADGVALLVANGVYGERMGAMLAAHGKPHVVVAAEWLHPLPLAEVEAQLLASSAITHVVAVHHETTTGRLNDLPGLGALCRKHGRRLLLDAVSSFGGEALDFEGWNLEAVAATANKCLHGAPGVAFVLARRDAFTGRGSAARSVYLDLGRYQREQQTGSSPFTPAVHSMRALQEALAELEEAGGWEARRTTYRARSGAVRERLAARRVGTLLPLRDYASMLTSFELPEGRTYASVHDPLLAAGFVIYAGQGPLAARGFRIATMGEILPDDLARLLAALDTVFP